MTATFETKDFGQVEVTRVNLRGDASGYAYFKKQDYETAVNADGTFHDQWLTPFRVLWPTGFASTSDAMLEVTRATVVAFCAVDRAAAQRVEGAV